MCLFRFVLIGIFLISCREAFSCTLWGATGKTTFDGKTTLIAKNRDWTPNQKQAVEIVRPHNGFAYLGLIAKGDDEPGLKAGINSEGLAIMSASASNIPRSLRKQSQGRRGLMRKILSRYSSVAQVLDHQEIFSKTHPLFLLIADSHSILSVEIGLDGKYYLTQENQGILAHTNHYLSEPLQRENRKIGKSSRIRLARIQELLATPRPGFTLDDFIMMSRDRYDGPRNSILRDGATPRDERTVATWVAAIPRQGFPTVVIVLRNPSEDEKTYHFRLDNAFWRRTSLEPTSSN